MKNKNIMAAIGIPLGMFLFVCLIGGLLGDMGTDRLIESQIHGNKEERYQEGIALIEQGKWSEVGVTLVHLQKEEYKNSKVLYNYAAAKENLENDKDIVGISMANHYMEQVPDTYKGPFKEDILAFKQECSQKDEVATKEHNEQMKAQREAEEEANKITPGCRKVRLGMTRSEAEISMGKPYDINRTVGSYGTHEQWCYNGGVYLYFEDGILSSWQD